VDGHRTRACVPWSLYEVDIFKLVLPTDTPSCSAGAPLIGSYIGPRCLGNHKLRKNHHWYNAADLRFWKHRRLRTQS
jgi:hypothetical protein